MIPYHPIEKISHAWPFSQYFQQAFPPLRSLLLDLLTPLYCPHNLFFSFRQQFLAKFSHHLALLDVYTEWTQWALIITLDSHQFSFYLCQKYKRSHESWNRIKQLIPREEKKLVLLHNSTFLSPKATERQHDTYRHWMHNRSQDVFIFGSHQ